MGYNACVEGAHHVHARIQKVLSEGVITFFFVFVFFCIFVDEWRKDQNATISGPSSARQRNAIRNGVSLACRWRFAGGPMMALH